MTKEAKKRHLILHDPNIFKGLIILSIPLMINNLIKTIHDVIDMYFVADIPNYGIESVNAISLTFPVVFTFISLGIGLSAAGTALISQFVGSNQMEDAKKYASNLVMISLITGAALNVLSFFSAELIMKTMGLTGYELTESVKYLKIRSFELPVVFMFFAFTSIRQSTGDTVTPVIYGVVTMVVNIILTPLLITYFKLGVSGAAYATLIANLVIMPFGLMQLFKSKTGITISKNYLILDQKISEKIIRTAIPAAFGQAFTAIGFGIMNGVLVGYGKQTVAAFSVGNRISSLILHPVMAIGGVLSAYLGQNIGNQNPERARQTFKKAMILSVGLMTVGALIFLPFREWASSIFIKEDAVALALAKDYMFFLLLGLPLMGAFQNYLGTFNGTGNTKYTFILTVTRLWLLRIPVVLIFKNYTNLGSSGVWYAMLLSNIIILFIGMIIYKKIDYKPKIKIKKIDVLAAE
ncbi:MAG: MATE family efflux transporter [Bacillota bacterium]|nr:MAG: MATE family efflux transporter [Bacillota bacterium]